MNISSRVSDPSNAVPARRVSTYGDNPDLRPLLTFVAVALPVGWIMLSIPLVTDAPLPLFVLGTLYLGLVLPTVVLTRRDPHASMRLLLHDTVRPPRPAWLLLPAGLVIPVATYAMGALLGRSVALDSGFVLKLALANVLSSVLIVNMWEEMAWAGFVQRRLTARWGFGCGAVATALLFTGIHLPLSLYDADGVGDVAYNISVMVASGVGMRLLIGAFDTWGRRSILALAIIHATFNASSELVASDSDWIRYVVTLTLGLLAWALWHMTTHTAPGAAPTVVATHAGSTHGKVTR
ncbi:MAG TPA: type II CAAX endopeptidase family protein [Dermatophilaceae bacterium]|nr:type II CAAX endopeptidase family protein [Dermatophilaceae bacterium]